MYLREIGLVDAKRQAGHAPADGQEGVRQRRTLGAARPRTSLPRADFTSTRRSKLAPSGEWNQPLNTGVYASEKLC